MYGITCLRQTMNGSTLGLVHDFLIVRAFDGIESTPEGFEARSAGFPEHVTLESLPDRLPDVLSFMGTNVVPTTHLTMIIRNDRKAEFGWSKDFMNGIERYCSRLPFRHVPCLPPRLRLTHALQTPESCPERRIAHCRACVRTQTPFRENDSADRSHEAEVRRCRKRWRCA